MMSLPSAAVDLDRHGRARRATLMRSAPSLPLRTSESTFAFAAGARSGSVWLLAPVMSPPESLAASVIESAPLLPSTTIWSPESHGLPRVVHDRVDRLERRCRS